MEPNTRTKVLFLITKSNWGGAQRYVYDIATKLDKSKFEPVVAVGGDGVLTEMLGHAHIRVITINSLERDISIKKELLFAKELWDILRTEKPAVFHVNSSKAGGAGTLLGRLARVPRVIFTAHGWAFNEDRPWWQKIVIKALHYITVLLSHKTIAVSKAIVDQMNWPLAQKKMKTINPGRTIGVMYGKLEAREKLSNIHPPLASHIADTWVITIAELHPIKRIPILIKAVEQVAKTHPKLRLVLIGDGQQRQLIEAQVKEHALHDSVFLAGSVTEAARFLKAADLFILPSKSESYGYVVHEAGLANLPVIASDVGGLRDIINNGVTGTLIPPDNPEKLADSIEDFLTNTPAWKARADELYKAMSARSVDRMVDATAALYVLPFSK